MVPALPSYDYATVESGHLFHDADNLLRHYPENASWSSSRGMLREAIIDTGMIQNLPHRILTAGSEGDATKMLDTFGTVSSNVLLFFLIFGLSATVDMRQLRRQINNKFAIGYGVLAQFVIMPLLGFVSVVVLRPYGLTKAMGVTLLVVTSSPGGSYSNWWCSTFNAELALSVAMTAVSSMLSVVLLPTNLVLYTHLAFGVNVDDNHEGASILNALDFRALFIPLGVVIAAIVVGLASGYKWDNARFHVCANRFGSVCGLLLILTSFLLSLGLSEGEDSSNFWNQPWAFYVGVSFPLVAGLTLSNVISRSLRLTRPETVTISIECIYQNIGVASVFAITMYDGEERTQAIAVALFYGVVEAIIVGVYCIWAWKFGWTKAPPDENICVVVSKTYEVGDEGTSTSIVESDSSQHSEDEETGSSDRVKSALFLEGNGETGRSVEFEPDGDASEVTEDPVFTSGNNELGRLRATEEQPKLRRRGTQIEGSGFWARVFPPVLRHLVSNSESDREPPPDADESTTSREPIAFETPMKASKEDELQQPRARINTADTSLCSGASSASPADSSLGLGTVSFERTPEARNEPSRILDWIQPPPIPESTLSMDELDDSDHEESGKKTGHQKKR